MFLQTLAGDDAMTKITRSFSSLTTSDYVQHLISGLAELGLPCIDISESANEVVFTAMSSTGLVLGETNYIPNATGPNSDIVFARRSGVFTSSAVYGKLVQIRANKPRAA